MAIAYSAQDMCIIKEIRTSPYAIPGLNENSLNEMNALLNKGWVLLSISKIIFTENINESHHVQGEALTYVLGFPRNGIDSIADRYRDEFVRSHTS